MVKPLYRCTQAKLYSVAYLAWGNCSNLLSLFAYISAKYTPEFIEQRKKDILYAQSLPDFQARTSKAETLLIQLLKKIPHYLKTYQRLKRYITNAFPKQNRQPQFDAAGLTYYRKAALKDREAVIQMITAMYNYIQTNHDLLSERLNMPSTFPAEVLNLKNNFIASHQEYLETRQEANFATETKITANNLIYTDLHSMLSDAKTLDLTPSQRKQFIFSSLLKFLSRPGTSGIKGAITDAETDEPIPFVTLQIPSESIIDFATAQGTYKITHLTAGKHKLLITPRNEPNQIHYLPQEIEITINKGRTSTLNIKLKRA